MKNAQALDSTGTSAATLKQLLERDNVVAGLLFLAGLASRLLFPSHILYHWDSVNFAFAINEFSVAKEQPQPPGYIVYVWLTQLVNAVTRDAQITMLAISFIASALSVAALFYLGRSMFSRRVGVIAALLLASSPLFWFYGEIALPHTLDTLLVIVTVWWFYETMKGNHRFLYPAIVVAAVAGGVRQQTLIFLGPLMLFAMLRVGWKRFVISGILGAVISVAWFVPLVTLNGGLQNYLHVMSVFSDRFQSTTSVFAGGGWFGIRRNLIKLTLYTAYGWGAALAAMGVYTLAGLWRRNWPTEWKRAIFLTLWVAPTVLFYLFIHMGQQGLVFVYLPALLLVSAAGLEYLLSAQARRLAAATAALVLINIGVFVLGPEYPLGPDAQRLLTRETLVNSDEYYQARFEAIRENFPAGTTLIVASNWRHVQYYLPEYRLAPFGIVSKWELGEGSFRNDVGQEVAATPAEMGLQLDAAGHVTVIIFDPDLLVFNATPNLVKTLAGGQLAYMELRADDQLVVNAESYGILTR
ncbi:MAG: glycosyltransferase family 39 protein [Chloroflexi bacterium]|nr:glycosyltransferase family 39 protein [Chloroflexota bacterium]